MAMTIIDATPSDLKRRIKDEFEGEMQEPHLSEDDNISNSGGNGVASFRGGRVVKPSTDARAASPRPSSAQSVASTSQRSGASLKKRNHPWGPDAQGLPEVDTVAGDTATMTQSEHPSASAYRRTGTGFLGGRANPTPQQRIVQHAIQERQRNQRPQTFTDRLGQAARLRDEELEEDFRSASLRQGIETARKKKLAAMSSWKTPYEVDAPRAIMLPRENPQETSTSSSSGGDASSMDPMTVEQKIWKGIEALIADTFSSDDDTTTVATSDILPRALVRAISTRSFISAAASSDLHSVYSSSTSGTRSTFGSRSSPLATMSEEDELTMAQAALDTFIDLLVPEAGGRSSVPTLASYSTPSSGTTSRGTSPAEGYDEIAIAEVALHNFMDVLLQEVETASTSGALSSDGSTVFSAKGKAALQLLDLFQWTLKMNVDGEERLRFLESERERQARRERELEEQIRLHEEQLRMQRDAELQAEIDAERELEEREEQLWQEHIKQMEQEEAEKQAAGETEAIGEGAEEADQYQRRSSKRSKRKKGSSKSPTRAEPIDPGAALELRLYDQAERLRVEAEGEPDDFDVYASVRRAELSTGSVSQPDRPVSTPVTKRTSLLELDTPITRGDGTGTQVGGGLLMAPAPQRESSSTLNTMSTGDSAKRLSSTTSSTPGSNRWATIGGMPIVMPGDEGSIDPTQFPSIHDRVNRAVASSSELTRRNAGSSTASNSDVSAKSMPPLLPSESKRLLFIKDDFTSTSGVSEELSLDPAEFPNLAKSRVDRNQREHKDSAATSGGTAAAGSSSSTQRIRKKSPSRKHTTDSTSGKTDEQAITASPSQAPQWFGGRQIIMSTPSEASDDNSPDSHETNLLPNSFYSGENIHATLSESGSTNPSITKLSAKRHHQGGFETAAGIPSAPTLPGGPDVPKPDDELPDLRSISEGSMSTAASGSTTSATRESYSNVFTNSFTGRGDIESPTSSQTSHASERFFSPKTSPVMNASMAKNLIVGDGAATQESSDDPRTSSAASFVFPSSDSAAFGDFTPVEGRGGTFRSGSKTSTSTKTPIDQRPADRREELERQQQILQALSAVAKKKAKLDAGKSIPSDKHFRSTSNAHTDVASLGSAGDIHIMGTWVRFSRRELNEEGTGGDDAMSDEITLDSHLVRDELRFGNGGRTSVPAVKPNAGRRRSFGSRIRSSINAFRCRGDSWPCRQKSRYAASRRATATSTSRKPKLEKKLSSRRCLLYAEEEGYDRTPIGYDDTEITPGGLIGIDEHEYL